ncbi:MAG: DUF4328 domain-containing protein [Croceibacterium sp.]
MQGQAVDATISARANRAIYAAGAVIVGSGLMGLFEMGQLIGLFDLNSGDGASAAYALISALFVLAYIGSIVLVAMWIHRAHANLQSLGVDGLSFTPGWAVGWYFIPFANLIKPFQAMRELWNVSFGNNDGYSAEAPGNVKVWWACWIISNVLSNASMRMTLNGMEPNPLQTVLDAVSTILTVACAVLLIKLIRQITDAQNGGMRAARVFA